MKKMGLVKKIGVGQSRLSVDFRGKREEHNGGKCKWWWETVGAQPRGKGEIRQQF